MNFQMERDGSLEVELLVACCSLVSVGFGKGELLAWGSPEVELPVACCPIVPVAFGRQKSFENMFAKVVEVWFNPQEKVSQTLSAHM